MPVGSGAALGFNALLGFGEETTWGTKITATSFMEFNSESFSKDIEEEKLESLGGGRGFIRRVLKQVSVAGNLSYDLHPIDGTRLIRHAMMGSVTSAQIGATGSYNHTFGTGDISQISQKGLSFEVRPDSLTTTSFYFTGMRVNSMKISGEVNQPVKAEMSFVGKDGTTGAFATTTALYSPAQPFLFQHVYYYVDGSIASLTSTSLEQIISFELTLENNLQSDNDARSLGDVTPTTLPPGRRSVMLAVTQRYDTTTAWDRFRLGTQLAARVKIDTGVTIGAVAGAGTYAITFDLPQVYFNKAQPEIGGPGLLTYKYDLTAIANSLTSATAGGNDIIITLTNSQTSY